VLPFKLLFHPAFTVDLGDHVFPAQKYRLVREYLLASRAATENDFVSPRAATDGDVRRVHTPQYTKKLKTGRLSVQEQRILEVPWSKHLVDAAWLAAGAAIEAGRLALRDGCAIVIGGGFHHAFPDHGEGFCLVHDVAIAIAALRASNEVKRVGVIDLDVHQGNGTGAILGTDPEAFTLSIHQEQNYPAVKPSNHLDVGLPDDTGDEPYLAALDAAMAPVFSFAPELLFYLAGADPYEHDQLGGLAVTLEGLRERDRRVLSAARHARVPIAVTLAGGYATHTADTVAIHANTVAAAAAVFGASHRRS
jgi:acetoin utilization deacetylase AcuC-like enzyme